MARPSNVAIKQSLTRRFPAVKWSVKSGRGTASSWTEIKWTDGPSDDIVTAHLATLGAAPGFMDNTDYYNGERVLLERRLSPGFELLVAGRLLRPKQVPPPAAWSYYVQRPNGGGYTLHECICRAAHHRERFEEERYRALAWLEAWAHGLKEAPQCVVIPQ